RNSNPRRSSVTPPLLDDQIGSRQNAIADNLFCTCGEVRPLDRTLVLLLGDNMPDDTVALPKFDRISRSQPRFEASGVPELTDVHRRHTHIVPHYVARCQDGGSFGGCRTPVPVSTKSLALAGGGSGLSEGVSETAAIHLLANDSRVGPWYKYQTIARRTITSRPLQASFDRRKLIAALETAGTRSTMPSNATRAAIRRAQLCSRHNPRPMAVPPAAMSRN